MSDRSSSTRTASARPVFAILLKKVSRTAGMSAMSVAPRACSIPPSNVSMQTIRLSGCFSRLLSIQQVDKPSKQPISRIDLGFSASQPCRRKTSGQTFACSTNQSRVNSMHKMLPARWSAVTSIPGRGLAWPSSAPVEMVRYTVKIDRSSFRDRHHVFNPDTTKLGRVKPRLHSEYLVSENLTAPVGQ